MNLDIKNAKQQFKKNYNNEVSALKEFLRIPTISSDSNHKEKIREGAKWLIGYFNKLGAHETFLLESKKHPAVYSHILGVNELAPTILVYGHYDVQPPDPIELWQSAPFEPEVRENNLYARGASDMKGQLLVALAAIKSIQDTGKLPVNFKFFIEGEEEIGSPSVKDLLQENKELLRSDFILNLDAGIIAKDKPTIVYALRGLAYFEIHVKGPGQDLHSGLFGGVVRNPIQALSELIAGMKDEKGVILLPGFYDNVLILSEKERKSLEKLGMDESFYKQQTGSSALHGEDGYTPTERVGARPTLDVNGIIAGYTGEGPKTVIPSKAMAKISMRLVPNQNPEEVHHQIIEYMQKNTPKDISWHVDCLSTDPACYTDPDFYAVNCFSDALESVWNKKPVFQRGGGSIPIVSYFKEILGLESVMSGFSLPEDNIHSPNEKLDLEMFEKGVETVIHFIFNIAGSCGDQNVK